MRLLVFLALVSTVVAGCAALEDAPTPTPAANASTNPPIPSTPVASPTNSTPVSQTFRGELPPVQPAPVTHEGETATMEIGPEGGTITSLDGLFEVLFPVGALDAPARISVTIRDPSTLPADAPPALSPIYVFETTGEWNSEGSNATLPKITMNFGGALPNFGEVPVLAAVVVDPLTGQDADDEWAANLDLIPDGLRASAYVRSPGLIYFTSPRVWITVSPAGSTQFVGDSFQAYASFRFGPTRSGTVTSMDLHTFQAVGGVEPLEAIRGPAEGVSHALKFVCKEQGVGEFGASFWIETIYGEPPRRHRESILAYQRAHCLGKPSFTATLDEPNTNFTLDPNVTRYPTPNYQWRGPGTCGVFIPPEPTTPDPDVEGPVVHARWWHPDAAEVGDPWRDANSDGVPDLCDHSYGQNLAHPGVVSVLITYTSPYWSSIGKVECSYEGTASGVGTCSLAS